MDLEISELNQAEDSVQERAAKLLCGGFRKNQPEAWTDLRSARRTFEAVLVTKGQPYRLGPKRQFARLEPLST